MDKLFQYATKLNTVYNEKCSLGWVRRIIEPTRASWSYWQSISISMTRLLKASQKSRRRDIEYFDTKGDLLSKSDQRSD